MSKIKFEIDAKGGVSSSGETEGEFSFMTTLDDLKGDVSLKYNKDKELVLQITGSKTFKTGGSFIDEILPQIGGSWNSSTGLFEGTAK